MSAAHDHHGESTSTPDPSLGLCPVDDCGRQDGFVNFGREHWCYCLKHKVRWHAGSNLFDCWRHETAEEQEANRERIGFDALSQVRPVWPEPVREVKEYSDLLGDEDAPTAKVRVSIDPQTKRADALRLLHRIAEWVAFNRDDWPGEVNAADEIPF